MNAASQLGSARDIMFDLSKPLHRAKAFYFIIIFIISRDELQPLVKTIGIFFLDTCLDFTFITKFIIVLSCCLYLVLIVNIVTRR